MMQLMASNMLLAGTGEKEDPKTILQLSANEQEFLQMACTELTYQEIAQRMSLSPKTIEGYREKLFQKFKVSTRIGLFRYALQHGLTTIKQH